MTIHPIRFTGRPTGETDRLPQEIACYDLLDQLGISYDRVDHTAAHTIADCAAIEKVLGAPICKNLVLCNRQKTSFYLLLMEGESLSVLRSCRSKLAQPGFLLPLQRIWKRICM